MGDRYAVIDCPGSLEFSAEADPALPAVDLAVVVADPEPAKALLLQPTLRELERLGVPRALFINKMDQARGPLDELLTALAPAPEGLPTRDPGAPEGCRAAGPGQARRLCREDQLRRPGGQARLCAQLRRQAGGRGRHHPDQRREGPGRRTVLGPGRGAEEAG